MKKAVRKSIQIGFLGVMFLLTSFNILAQPTVIEPGDSNLNPALVNTGKFTWGTKITDKANLVTVQRSNQEITIETRETKKGIDESNQTLVLNAKTLEPIRQNYKDEDRTYSLQYGARVKGIQNDFETNKKENIDAVVTGRHFDPASLPYVISSLPISLDYRVTLPVMRLNSSWQPTYLRYRITDVSEQKSFSCLSGVHELWKVTVNEKTRNHMLIVYFDKTTRRILRTEQSFDGIGLSDNTYILFDKETDVNPIKAAFNEAETKAMLSGGSSSIKGQASTKISEKRLPGNKTQFAPKGSLVALIPNTAYFKEWVDFNLTIGNISRPVYFDGVLVGGCSYPLPHEVKKHSLITDVIDNKGNFIFQNVKPGEYLVFVGFVANKYTHTTRTFSGWYSTTTNEETGVSTTSPIIDVTDWMSPQNIINHQFVKVTKDGETVSVKLNK